MEDNDFKQMRRLYERFMDDVRKNGHATDYYEQDDLIDIFGVASDEGDTLAQFYVFLTAARLFPNDDFLDERMAYFLFKLQSYDAAYDMMAMKRHKDTPLWHMLALETKYVDELPPIDVTDDFIVLLNSFKTLDGETLIRLVDFLRNTDNLNLLVEYFDILKTKVEDLPALLYEVADALDMAGMESEETLKMSEELTTLEPFNSDNWLLHADQAASLGHLEEALNAVDYAIALNPDDPKSLLLKGSILVEQKENAEEGERLLKQILSQDPNNFIAARNLAQSYINRGLPDPAYEVFISYLENNEECQPAFWEAAKIKPERLGELLRRYGKSTGISDNILYSYAQDPAMSDMRLIMAVLHEVAKSDQTGLFVKEYIRQLYDNKLYSIIAEFVHGESPANLTINLEAQVIVAATMLRLDNFEEAAEIARHVLSTLPKRPSTNDAMTVRGVRSTLEQILRYALHPDTIPDGYDPLND